jgi:molybdopterin-guanine dinucleotide biosynthesis protein B
MKKRIPLLSFVGRSNSGKTTYLEKLIKEMKQRGYKIATIKHDVHGFEMDKPGKDTYRHAEAGADIVCISSPAKMAMIKKVEVELTLEQVAAHIDGVDIIFTEGYKREAKQKIEIFRQAAADTPLCQKGEAVAFATDTFLYEGELHFSLDDPRGMADFLIEKFIKGSSV